MTDPAIAPEKPRQKGRLKDQGFALMAVLIIVIIVPIVVFGATFFITSSISRYDAQTRNMKALYLAEAGIHRAIYNIRSTGSLGTVANWDANNQIAVTAISGCSNQFKSVGTSVQGGDTVKRTVYAQVSGNNVQIYMEGSEAVNPLPPCCSTVWWPFSEGAGTTTGTAPYTGTLGFTAGANPAWTTDRLGAAGKALWFNNGANYNNYVLVLDSTGTDIDLTTTGTIMAWVNSTTHVTNAGVVTKGTGAQNAYALRVNRQNNNWAYLELWIGNTRRWRSPTNFLGTGTWYHVAVSWGPGKVQGYRNGAPGTAVAATYTAPSNAQNIYIGTGTTVATAFKGKIDEVYIYKCQKTDAEIKAYYNSTCAGSGATPCPQP